MCQWLEEDQPAPLKCFAFGRENKLFWLACIFLNLSHLGGGLKLECSDGVRENLKMFVLINIFFTIIMFGMACIEDSSDLFFFSLTVKHFQLHKVL